MKSGQIWKKKTTNMYNMSEFLKAATVRPCGRAKMFRNCARFGFFKYLFRLSKSKIFASFSCFKFISPTFVQSLKYFAQSCDRMIAAFRNSIIYVCPGVTWSHTVRKASRRTRVIWLASSPAWLKWWTNYTLGMQISLSKFDPNVYLMWKYH